MRLHSKSLKVIALGEQDDASPRNVGLRAFGLSALFHLTVLFLLGLLVGGTLPKSETPVEVFSEVFIEQIVEPEEAILADTTNIPSDESDPTSSPSEPKIFGSAPDLVTVNQEPQPSFTMPASLFPFPSSFFGNTHRSNSNLRTVAKHEEEVLEIPDPLGASDASAEGLVGYFYDLKQSPDHTPRAFNTAVFQRVVAKFVEEGWNPRILDAYYKVNKPRTVSQFFIPQLDAGDILKAFGAEKEVKPRGILIHYRGNFIAPKSGTFRFAGNGADILFVRINNRDVLNTSSPYAVTSPLATPYPRGKIPFAAGEWFSLQKGQSYSMEVLIGECPGGLFQTFLMIQNREGRYATDPMTQLPILPLFQITPTKIPRYALRQTAFTGGYRFASFPTVASEAFAGLEPEPIVH